jgi:hypothetical protein
VIVGFPEKCGFPKPHAIAGIGASEKKRGLPADETDITLVLARLAIGKRRTDNQRRETKSTMYS